MRKLSLLAVLAIALAAGAATLPLFPPATASAAVGVSVDIRPSSSAPVQPLRSRSYESPYLVSADITNAAGVGGRIAPLTVYPGHEEVRAETIGGLRVRLVANISADGSRAETVVTVHRGGRLLTNQRAAVWLQPSNWVAPNQPLR